MLASICGIAVTDIVTANLPRLAEPGELIFTSIQCCIGGHACNVSIDLVKMGTAPTEISVIIPVGNDIFGDFLRENLERIGVITHFFETASPTSKDVILVVKGEDRRFHVDAGANLHLSSQYVRKVLHKDRPFAFYIGGTGMLGETDEKLAEICREAKKSGSFVFVDVVNPYKKEWSFIVPAFKWIDIFHCNDLEAKKMTGEKNLVDAVKKISGLGVKATL
ncbi:MAG: carbohydrate kinase family protein, partial [Candidatus Bathyarchaeota archaeon]